EYDEAFGEQSFLLSRQPTNVTFVGSKRIAPGASANLKALLSDGEGRTVPERFVQFVLTNVKTNQIYKTTTTDTNFSGKINLGRVLGQALPLGTYTIEATFAEDNYYLGSDGLAIIEIGYWIYLPLISK
ncbi:MAG: 5-hydroxyisourate hydrolase-like protein (transthyretin family), partial [Cellvibrionaceae bacterium]